MSRISTLVDNLVKILSDITVNDGGDKLFGRVFDGEPNKLPVTANSVAVVELANNNDFKETTCPTCYNYNTNVYITIYTKGDVSVSRRLCRDASEVVQDLLMTDDKTIDGACSTSKVVDVFYGELADTERVLISASRIVLSCSFDVMGT